LKCSRMRKIKRFNEFLHSFRWVSLSHSENRIIICPRCGSQNIRLSSKFDAWLTPKRYVCNDCGYIGPIILEIKVDKCKSRRE